MNRRAASLESCRRYPRDLPRRRASLAAVQDQKPTYKTLHPRWCFPQNNVSFLRDTYTFNFPAPPSELVDAFRLYYGPTMNAFEAAEKNGRAADLRKDLNALFESQNISPRKDTTSIPATFLRVTVAVR